MNTTNAQPFGFNPASSGFPAKVWECMRRNPDFTRDVEETKKARKQGGINSPAFIPAGHPCSYFVGYALVHGGYREQVAGPLIRFTYRDPWPKLPTAFRERLSAMLAGEPLSEIRVYDETNDCTVDIASIAPWYRDDMTADEFWQLFVEFYGIDRRILTVPRFVRDSEHRKALMRSLDKLIPKAAPKSGRKFKAGGRALGSVREWDAYLAYQHYLPMGELEAKQMASWFCFGREEFSQWNERDRCSAAGLAQARSFHEKQSTHTTTRIKAIEQAIADVYPAFRPKHNNP